MTADPNIQQEKPSSTMSTTASTNTDILTLVSNALGGKSVPETPEEAAFVEEILAAELNELSLVERDLILFDVHGLPTADEDDPPNVNEYFTQLERALEESSSEDKSAYELVVQQYPNYVSSNEFRLMFLRSEKFDVPKTAAKIIHHFNVKRYLFGDGEVMGRPVKLKDLSEDDMESLEAGFIQVSPTRDAAGRTILLLAPGQRKFKALENLMRTMWYTISTALMDEDSQKKGIVAIMYKRGTPLNREDWEHLHQVMWVREALPKKVVAVHQCVDESLRPLLAAHKLFLLTKDLRARVRPHVGDHEDVLFELQTYGIPANEELILPDGSLSLAWHQEWLGMRRAQEEEIQTGSKDDGVILPKKFDVLFGRGKNTREHTGNLRCALLVEMHLERYEKANKQEKTEITRQILAQVHDSGGRFLKHDKKTGWQEVDRDAAREKISHFFRFLRSKVVSEEGQPPESELKRVTPTPAPSSQGVEGQGEPSSKQFRGNDI
eukprot:CAMPEP_0178741338 /NCGR_PEP_ID=MMETSP0744-20121128/5085_1 /TAXON_ID=913974 /ORGANISM="Nitzschia punctata, Strain CCMP561" /LENGTH=493 /DNA_ID=CAMNT_0020394201 /DNA_START=7 /DNA_END=1488 /DNA_ORIENTATION=+